MRCALAISFVLAASGCSNGSSEQTGYAGPAVVADLANVVVLPTYEDLGVATSSLRDSLVLFDEHPDASSLVDTQKAWRSARSVWKRSQAFAFGPVETGGHAASIDWWPVKPEAIEDEIAGRSPISADRVATLGTSAKGFMALEYLLFDAEGGDAVVLAALTDGELAARRRAFARALGEDLAAHVAAMKDAWSPGAGNYAGQLTNAGTGSSEIDSPKAAVDLFVNQSLFLAEFVADSELGKPLGKPTGGEPRPELEEARRSDNSIADMLDHLRGIESVYDCTYAKQDGMGLADLVRERNQELDGDVQVAIDSAIESVQAIPSPLRTSLLEHPKEVDAAWEAVKTLKRILGTEVVSVLGTTVKFNGNDGD